MESILISPNQNSFSLKSKEQKQFVLLLTETEERLLEINLAKNSRVEILGIVLGTSKHQIKLTTKQNHIGQNSSSNLLIKSILKDNSSFDFSGLIRIEKEAQNSHAYQRNENLLLGENVKCDTKPYLEILANDVVCTHGATMGQIDQEQLFYLESRGLDKKTAEALIVEGFLRSLLDKISDLAIVESIRKKIAEKGYGTIP